MSSELSRAQLTFLLEGVDALGMALDDTQIQQIQTHLELIVRWHSRINLVSYEDSSTLITHHALDSLAVAKLFNGSNNVLDVGTGAGFPGLVLAAALPQRHFTLLDSRQRRIEFLRLVIGQANFENVEVNATRIENFKSKSVVQDGFKFDTLVARAVTSLVKLVALTDHLHFAGLRLVAMKGQNPQAELEELEQNHTSRLKSVHVEPIHVPFLNAQRHAVIIEF